MKLNSIVTYYNKNFKRYEYAKVIHVRKNRYSDRLNKVFYTIKSPSGIYLSNTFDDVRELSQGQISTLKDSDLVNTTTKRGKAYKEARKIKLKELKAKIREIRLSKKKVKPAVVQSNKKKK